MTDKYKRFEELRRCEREGEDYAVYVRSGRSGIAVIAPHGGGIEPGTSEIADALAGSEHTFYTFKGIKACGNKVMHITSRRFDEPNGLSAVINSRTVVSIHGSREENEFVYIGGLDGVLMGKIKEALEEAGFSASEYPRSELRGRSPANLCNRGTTGAGVQLEIARGLRRRMFQNLDCYRIEYKTEVFTRFISALRKALADYH